ncbi:MAG: hypothetical protein HQK51_19665 [Oligoflexia bacterium]|nr:hypothetical protein [Oligoflexia bacterium]
MKKVLALVIALSIVSMSVFAEGESSVGEKADCACDKVSSASVKDSQQDSSTKVVGSDSIAR